MRVYTLLKRGTNHKDFCEDYLITVSINENIKLFGVFDGCSSGIDSHFASSLTGKIIKNEAKKIKGNNNKDISDILKKIIFKSFKKILKLKMKIGLNTNELLSTFIIYIFDKENNIGEIIVSGDGFISIDSKRIIIDKNNNPNYFIYKGVSIKEDFVSVFNTEIEIFKISNPQDITISTDGIFSFTEQNISSEDEKKKDHIDFLTEDTSLLKNTSMLYKKYNILKNKHGLINYDDLGMIRVLR